MEIIGPSNPTSVIFEGLDIGTIFKLNGVTYMKISEAIASNGSRHNAVSLATGISVTIPSHYALVPLNAKLVLSYKE